MTLHSSLPQGQSTGVFKAAATKLCELARQVEDMGADLCADPEIVHNHLTALQTIDRLAQHLDQIADVISAEDPVSAVDMVKLSELKEHLHKAA